MKETKCDYCGKVIDGYYPSEKIKARWTAYNFNCVGSGKIKQNVNFKLSVDCKWNRDPVEYHFCSVDCLRQHTHVIDGAIERAREKEALQWALEGWEDDEE